MRGASTLVALALAFAAEGGAGERVPLLVELFTSEGCSSCPPADRLLARLHAEQPVGGVEVVALSWHVDYWNDLGWVDPFTTPGATERQRDYARRFDLRSAYTPQLVIDGEAQVVGNDESAALAAIRSAAARAHAALALRVIGATVGRPVDTVRFEIDGPDRSRAGRSGSADLLIVLVEDGLSAEVPSGENAGRTLRHDAVAREIHRIADFDGGRVETGEIALRSRWDRSRLRVVAFVQERKTRRVLAAATVAIPVGAVPSD